MYRELIQARTTHALFGEPATESEVSALETALGVGLPQPVRQLLLEANGVQLVMPDWRGEEDAEDLCFEWFWPVQEILEETLLWRDSDPEDEDEADLPRPLVLFASLPNGDRVGFTDSEEESVLYVWAHDAVAGTRVAGDIEDLIKWTLTE